MFISFKTPIKHQNILERPKVHIELPERFGDKWEEISQFVVMATILEVVRTP